MKKMNHFLDMDENLCREETAHYAILPVPYDGTSTFVKGANKGPQAILDASDSLELYDIQYQCDACQAGIYTDHASYNFSTPDDMVASVYQNVKHFLKRQKRIVLLGGEHSISIGAVRAMSEQYHPLTVLQFDAHADMRESYNGSPYNHACVMQQARQYARVVQVGVRNVCTEELPFIVPENIFYAHQIVGENSWMEQALARLGDRVYITFDLDAFDPSLLPATGTPLPGGLAWYPVLSFLKRVFQNRQVVGVDVVELCPQPENKSSDVVAASLVYKMITLWEKYRSCAL